MVKMQTRGWNEGYCSVSPKHVCVYAIVKATAKYSIFL